MNSELQLGKANNATMEKLHNKVADIYIKGVDSIASRGDIALTKDDISLLKGAQSFLKENNVVMDVVKSSGSKKFSSTVGKLLKEKREFIS